MRIRRFCAIPLVILLIAAFAGCSKEDSPAAPQPSNALLTVSGKVTVKKMITVPPAATFTAVWVVSSGSPDYEYVFGNGTIDWNAKTFSITFTQIPPDSALNKYTSTLGLGVGMICVSDLTDIKPHVISEQDAGTIYGIVNNAAVIYVKGNPKDFTSPSFKWPADFKAGFNVGKGVKGTGTFDTFIPVDPTNLELIISADPNDFVIPNWT